MERSEQGPPPEGGSTEPPEAGTCDASDSVVIARTRAELYAFWRDFTNLPKFMSGLERVTEVDSLSYVWTVVDREGRLAEWEIIVTDDQLDRLIAWSASGRSPRGYRGRVEFLDAPEDRGTQVTTTAHHPAAEGLLEQLRERVAGPVIVMQMPGDLARLKSLMESGVPVRVRERPLPSGAGTVARERGVIAPERDERTVSQDLQSHGGAHRWPCGTARANVAPTGST